MFNKLPAQKINWSPIRRVIPIIIFLLLSAQVFPHGDLLQRQAKNNQEILKSPNNFELYADRGFLCQQHGEFNRALKVYFKSEALGNTDKVLLNRIAEVNYLAEDHFDTLNSTASYLVVDSIDVKAKKLEAQILFKRTTFNNSINVNLHSIDNMKEIRPEDILNYTNIVLTQNSKNNEGAINAIEYGLKQLRPNTLFLQLKKLGYPKDSDQAEKVLNQYNYFILGYKRNEFWHYSKAEYFTKINSPQQANLPLKRATNTIGLLLLDAGFKNMNSILKIKEQIKS